MREDEQLKERKRKISLDGEDIKPKRKRRRQSKESEPKKPEEPEEESVDETSVLLQKEEAADEVLKEYKKKKEKEKRAAEMRIEVCECCGTREQGPLLPCEKCRTVYHAVCLKKDPEATELLCSRCDPAADAFCCLCQQSGDLLTCNIKLCSRRYHKECLEGFHSPSAKMEKPRAHLTCPAHYCHTCVSELGELHPPGKKQMLRCIECPTSYHASNFS